MGKFYNIDPSTCSMEELKQAIKECKLKEEYFHTMEQSCKVFINSQYGALASPYYQCSNVDIAESITLQGQDLIKYSVKVVNAYFKEQWPTDTEKHNRICHYMKEKFNDAKTTLSLILSPSNVGLGREFSGAGGTLSTSASKIIPVLNALTSM
jgi:hypothetical protein